MGWTTDARIGFPLPFGRGEGQGEGIDENTPTGCSFPLTPALSPSAGERENRTTASVFCSPSHRLHSNDALDEPLNFYGSIKFHDKGLGSPGCDLNLLL